MAFREVWLDKTRDFTPWLADNSDALGEALGLMLDLQARELRVRGYSLALLLQDVGERAVAVENQLEPTNHTHLGQLLTYCAGTKADVVVWVSQSIPEEHAAAVEWLNENTIDGIGFLGIEVELLPIAGSPPPPHFKVVVRPNHWAKSVRPARSVAIRWTSDTYDSELKMPADRVAVVRTFADAIVIAIEECQMPWQPVLNKGYVAFRRRGGYDVLVVDVSWSHPPRMAVNLPDEPSGLQLANGAGPGQDQ